MTAPVWMPLAGAAIQGLGAGIGGRQQQIAQRNQLAEDRRQFNVGNARDYELGQRSVAQGEGAQAAQIAQQMRTAPLRDQAQFALMGRLGVSPQAFRPTDMFNPSSMPPQQGGVNLDALAARQQTYRPGMGGQLDTSMEQAILNTLGFSQQQGAGQAPGQWQGRGPTASASEEIAVQGMPADTFIQHLARQGDMTAIRSIAETGVGPSTNPGAQHRYNPQQIAAARAILEQQGQGLAARTGYGGVKDQFIAQAGQRAGY